MNSGFFLADLCLVLSVPFSYLVSKLQSMFLFLFLIVCVNVDYGNKFWAYFLSNIIFHNFVIREEMAELFCSPMQ